MNLPSLNEPHAGTNLDAEKALGSFVANGSAQSRFGMRPGRGGMMKEGADFSQMMTGLSGLFKTAGPEVIPSVAAEKVQKATGAEGDLRVGMTDQQEEDIPDSGKAISLLAVPFQSSLPVETFFSSSSSTGALQLLFLVNEPMMRKAGQGGEGEEKISVSGSGVLDSTFRVKSENVSEIFRFAEDGLNASPGSQAARVNDGRVPHGGGAELQSAEGRDDSPEGSLGGFGFQAERVKDASFQDTAVAFERPGQSTLRDGEKPVALPGDGPGRQGEASLRHSGNGKVVSMAGNPAGTEDRPRETGKAATIAATEGTLKAASEDIASVRFDRPLTEKVSEGALPYRMSPVGEEVAAAASAGRLPGRNVPGSQAARVNDGRVPHGGGAELQSAEGRDDSPEGSLGGFRFQAERVKDASFQDTAFAEVGRRMAGTRDGESVTVAFERPGQSTLRDGEKPVALPGDGPGRQGEASLRHSGNGKVVSMAGNPAGTEDRPRETGKAATIAATEGTLKAASEDIASVRFDRPLTEKVSEGALPYRMSPVGEEVAAAASAGRLPGRNVPGSQAARVNDGRVPHGGGAELQSAEGRDDSPEGSLGGFRFQAERVKDASFQDTAFAEVGRRMAGTRDGESVTVAFERPGQSTLRDGEKPVALPGDGPGRQGEASLRHSGSGKVVSMAGHDTATAVRPRETRKSANNANAEGINKVASGEMVSVRFDQPSTEKVSEGAFPYRSVLDQVREGMVAGFKDGGRVRITLYPESLGRVDMDIVLRQDRVDVIMKVDSNQVHQLLSSRVEDLKATLQNQGWQVSGVDVMLQKHNDMNDGNNFANMFSWPDRMNRDRHSGGMAGGRNGNRAAESMDDISAAMRKPPVGTTNGLSIFA